MFKEAGVNRSAVSCNPKLRLKHVNSSATMALQIGPVSVLGSTRVQSRSCVQCWVCGALLCLIPVSLPPFVLFISTNRFLLSRAQCWYFLCDVKIPRWLSAAFYGRLSENIVQQVLFCVFSPKATIYFLYKRRIVCLFVSDRTVKEMCIFVLNCNLYFKMSMGYLSHDLMSLW